MIVDLVMPYVNNQDKVWRKTYKDFCKSHAEYKDKLDAINGERFRDEYNLFNLNLKLIRICLPFIRNFYLIVSNKEQVEGLDLTGITLVLHEDIMPREILPTFNSSTIEMFIHNIKGLAEHFIYINDDMFPLRKMQPSDFFGKGTIKLNKYAQHETTNDSLFREMLVRQYREVFGATDDYLGDDFYIRPEHSVAPMLLSEVKKAREKYANTIDAHLEPFRKVEQHTQYLYFYQCVLDNKQEPSNLAHKYIRLRSPNFLQTCYNICNTKGSKYHWVCINDEPDDNLLKDKDLRNTVLKRALDLCLEYLQKGE